MPPAARLENSLAAHSGTLALSSACCCTHMHWAGATCGRKAAALATLALSTLRERIWAASALLFMAWQAEGQRTVIARPAMTGGAAAGTPGKRQQHAMTQGRKGAAVPAPAHLSHAQCRAGEVLRHLKLLLGRAPAGCVDALRGKCCRGEGRHQQGGDPACREGGRVGGYARTLLMRRA